MASCCACSGNNANANKQGLPLLCLVPRDDGGFSKTGGPKSQARPVAASSNQGFELLDEDYLRKHFNFPQRSLYLDTYRRPLITFPMTQENSNNFNLARKTKINQQILDGFLDAGEAITAPSIFPYAKANAEKEKDAEEEDEVIYILQLPDWEYECPVHKQTIRTPRFIWHSCKKTKEERGNAPKPGGGPLNRPKPWLLSRHTDFDLMSQW